MSQARERYEAAIARYVAGDVDGFGAAHAPDAALITPGGVFVGREAIGAYWRRQRTAFPDLALTLDVVVAEGEVVAAEWTWVGTNTGPLTLRDGSTVPATGRRVELRGMELARVRDGMIVEYRMYWDGVALARQLGQPAGSAAVE